jgi:proteasome lid subunit RPN8/RPN11
MRQERLLQPHMNDGVEHGRCMCDDNGVLILGPETTGDRYNVSVDIACPQGKPVGIFHTHPGGKPVPSPTDIRSAQQYKLKTLCIGVPETGEVRCHKVPPKRQ